MTQTEDFLAATMPRLIEAETALHNGDPGPRIAMWSRADPLTLFGAAASARSWAEIGPVFQWLGDSFSRGTSFNNEVIAAGASGNLAYTVALEHTTVSIGGAAPQPYVLRVTTIFRREHDEWKVVHRHGDALASGHNDDVAQQLLSGARLNVAQRMRKSATALCHSNPANRQEGTTATVGTVAAMPKEFQDRDHHVQVRRPR